MATNVTIPDFDFSAFYYPEILDALITYKRINAPELTDESEFEPTIQLLRAFSLVGHLNNVTVDTVANESTLPTAKLVETVRNMLRLIDYEMSPASPSQCDIVYELSKIFNTDYLLIEENNRVATKAQGEEPVIYFENLNNLSVARTDQFTAVVSEEDEVFTDFTDKANNQNSGFYFEPWVAPSLNDKLYFGHSSVMWDKLSLVMSQFADNVLLGAWEYRENQSGISPDSIDVDGNTLVVVVNSLLGSTNLSGAKIKLKLNETGVEAEAEVAFGIPGNYAIVNSYLGQSSPSTDINDYTVSSDWMPIPGVIDGSNDFEDDGDVEYNLPQDVNLNWIKDTINGVNAYWVRYRVIVPGAQNPQIDYAKMDSGKQYALLSNTQGRTQIDPDSSSDGSPSQSFESTKDYFIWGSETIEIEGEVWERVDNFLGSGSEDKHYLVTLSDNDRATWVFGDGSAGKIPPVGANNISKSYRYGSNDDGNVGANTVTVDKSGITFVSNIYNPRQAAGWQEAQGASEESLEKTKIQGPASLRTKEVALNGDDAVDMTLNYTGEDGTRPFVRAQAIEEGYGPKTIELVVVTSGGGLASTTQLGEIETYFNGDKAVTPEIKKRVVANQQVIAVNYTQRIIDVAATVYGDVEEQEILSSLSSLLQPEALKEDGITWEWEFGSNVPSSRISHEIFESNSTITKVVLTTPASDIQLQNKELPILGNTTINIIKPS